MKKTPTSQKLLLWTLVGFLALGQLGRIVIFPSIRIYPHDILLTLWSCWLCCANMHKSISDTTVLFKKLKPWAPFTLISLMSLGQALHNSFFFTPLLYLARLALYGLFAFALSQYSRITTKDFALASIGLGIITAFTGIVQLIALPDTRFLFVFGFDDHYYRMIGTQLDPAFQGALLLIACIVTWKHRSLLQHSYVTTTLMVIFGLAILATFSRASYLGLGVALIGIVLSHKAISLKKAFICAGIVLFVLAGVQLGTATIGGEGTNLLRTSTITARLNNLQRNLPTSTQAWIIGDGLFASSTRINHATTQHLVSMPNQARISNSLCIFILQSTGLLGLGAFFYALAHLYKVLLKKKASTTLLLLTTLLVITQFNNTLMQPFVLVSSILAFRSLATEYK